MEKNIGIKDKNIRLGAGAVFLILSFVMHSWVLAILGLVLIATALTGSCLLYQVLGIDTIGDKINKHNK
jgi:type IV secretory pathway TrbD component